MVHILEAFPNEIWLGIFYQVVPPLLYAQQQLLAPLSSFGSVRQIGDFNSEERLNKLSILGICKRLQAIAEEVFYTDVYIESLERYEQFISNATVLPSNRKRLGEWTKSIIIDIKRKFPRPRKPGTYIDLNPLTVACPNLQLLSLTETHFYSNQETCDREPVALDQIDFTSNWWGSLRSIYWDGGEITWETLYQVSIHCPQLIYLAFHSYVSQYHDRDLDHDITFPSLESLGTRGEFFEGFDWTKLHIPSIKRLLLKIKQDDPQIREFLKREGNKIEELALYPDYDRRYSIQMSSFDPFTVLPALRTFATWPQYFDSTYGLEKIPEINHERLHTLVLVYSQGPERRLLLRRATMQTARPPIRCPDPKFNNFSTLFKVNRFPNLTNIHVVALDRQRKEELFAGAKEVFPHLEVACKDGLGDLLQMIASCP